MHTDRPHAFGFSRRPVGIGLLGFLAALFPSAVVADAPAHTGEEIYRQKCVSCHGASGEGTDDHYPRWLVGERSVAGLARLIAKTMPEDAPGECVGEDAEKVAAFIYNAFYSKAAQARNKFKPPRIELSRLTVRQYRNAVADLIGSFRSPSRWDDERGLKADYSSRGRRRRGGNGGGNTLSRLDGEVQFDFGTDSPIPEQRARKELSKRWQQIPALLVPLASFRPFSQEFRVNWQGSLLAPDTGEYEFLVRTENAARLLVNNKVRPLIDALVKSGNDTKYRGSIYLLGGRAYPIRLELSRSKEKTSSIALEWKIPRRAFEVIPRRNLLPKLLPELLVLTTPFPPDDRTAGYERGTSVSKAWDQATTDSAIEVSRYVVAHLVELAGVAEGAADRERKLRDFCRRFCERAFRRPLTDEQAKFFIDRQFQGARDLDTAVKRVALLVLKSPRFVYREIGSGRPDGYDVASRLSFGLWDSMPDQILLDAAAAGQLTTREQVTRQAERMVMDPRSLSKLREFFLHWLKVDQATEIVKDLKLYPQFNEAVASDLRTSLDLFLDDVTGSESADFRQLLRADYIYLNGRLAQFYGAKLAPDAPFQKVTLEPRERAGLLTHPYLLSTFAYTAASSPIHRGVFLARSVLGRPLRPPPEAIAPLAPTLHPNLTTRERVTTQTKLEACQSCHGMINPLGFTLEHFDAVGRYRNEEKGRPIDAAGFYETRSGELVNFDGVREIAAFLADSEEAHIAFIQQLFHHLVKQPIRAFGYHELTDLMRFFATHDFNIRKLMVEVMATSALTPRGTKS
jgi:cytochrome c553